MGESNETGKRRIGEKDNAMKQLTQKLKDGKMEILLGEAVNRRIGESVKRTKI
jgi:hypothetical protein